MRDAKRVSGLWDFSGGERIMWLRLGVLVLLVLTSAVSGADPVDHEGVLKELLDAVRSGNTESMQGFLERRFGGSEGMDTLEFMSMP